MSTYGDRGNILTLQQRCLWRDIAVEIKEVNLKDNLVENSGDIYFFGGGQDFSQIQVSSDLKQHKKDVLVSEAKDRKVFLGICGGYQLLGHYYRDGDNNELEGLGILDITTVAGKKRMMGNILIESGFLKDKLVGFENHSGKTILGESVLPLGKVIIGHGNNGEDKTEGALQENVFGCYLHGPLLPKNPGFADHLIKLALQKKYGSLDLKFLNDTLETQAHQIAVARAMKTR